MRIELDKDGWPGFALGKDEELGIWTVDVSVSALMDGVVSTEIDGVPECRSRAA